MIREITRRTLTRCRGEFTPPGPIFVALGIGTCGGILFHWLGTPVPWLLGSLLAVMVAAVCGVNVRLPQPLRNFGMATLGTLVGTGFTFSLVEQLSSWWLTIVLMMLLVLLLTPVAYLIFRRRAGWSPASSIIAAVPGGFGSMVLIAEECGADVRSVSIAHMFRIITVIMLMPVLVQWFAGSSVDIAAAHEAMRIPADLRDWLILAACVVVGPFVGRALRLPAAVILGTMLVSAIVHMSGLVNGRVPPEVVACVQLLTGTWLGARFFGIERSALVQMLSVSMLVTAVSMPAVIALAWIVSQHTSYELLPLILAFAPGGMPEMSLVALALNLDPSFVIAHHLFRMGLLTLFGPLMLRPFLKRFG